MIRSGRDAWPAGYRGFRSDNNLTIAEVLRDEGYYTALAGKWHLGERPTPVERGFEDFYGFFPGASDYWDPKRFRRLPATATPRSYAEGTFYATEAITDYAIDFAGAARERHAPLFLFLSYNAPHFPLQAPRRAGRAIRRALRAGMGCDPRRAHRTAAQDGNTTSGGGGGAARRGGAESLLRPHARRTRMGYALRGTAARPRAPHGRLCGDGGDHGRADRAPVRGARSERTAGAFARDLPLGQRSVRRMARIRIRRPQRRRLPGAHRGGAGRDGTGRNLPPLRHRMGRSELHPLPALQTLRARREASRHPVSYGAAAASNDPDASIIRPAT